MVFISQSFFLIIFWNFEKSTIFDRPFRENYTYINKDIYGGKL